MDAFTPYFEHHAVEIREHVERAVARGWRTADLLVVVVDPHTRRVRLSSLSSAQPLLLNPVITSEPEASVMTESDRAAITCLPVSAVVALIESTRSLLQLPLEDGHVRLLSLSDDAVFFTHAALPRRAP